MNKKISLTIGAIFVMNSLVGCSTKNKVEIEKSFDKVLAMYPTKNLEDFYDMEGYRDSEFDKNDKGVWVFNTSMSVSESKDSGLVTEGMMLRMNRNTRKANGYYYVRTNWNDLSKPKVNKKYSVSYKDGEFILLENVYDEEIEQKVKNFQFFVQYGTFEKLDTYENIKKMYNSEVPNYELEYQLTNDDENVKKIRENYNVSTEKEPTLLLKGRGDLDGSSVGYKQLEFTFDKKNDVFFSDFIDFQPQNMEDMEYE